MFEDIINPADEKKYGHWKKCPSCGMIFDVDQDGESCPICNASDVVFDEISEEDMIKLQETVNEIVNGNWEESDYELPSEESPYP